MSIITSFIHLRQADTMRCFRQLAFTVKWWSRTHMRLRRDKLTIVLRPCAIHHKFRLCTEFTRARHVRAPTMRLRRDNLMIILQPGATRHKFRLCTGFTRDARWPSPTESQPGDKWKQRLPSTKNTRPTALCVGADPDRAARYEIQP